MGAAAAKRPGFNALPMHSETPFLPLSRPPRRTVRRSIKPDRENATNVHAATSSRFSGPPSLPPLPLFIPLRFSPYLSSRSPSLLRRSNHTTGDILVLRMVHRTQGSSLSYHRGLPLFSLLSATSPHLSHFAFRRCIANTRAPWPSPEARERALVCPRCAS